MATWPFASRTSPSIAPIPSLSQFWSALTGFAPDPHDGNAPDDAEALLLSADGRPALLFIAVPERKQGKNRVHLDLVPTGRRRDEEVDRLIGLGGWVVDDQRRPDGTGWMVCADPEGNEFCIERSDGERTADGHRDGDRGDDRPTLVEQLSRASAAVGRLISGVRTEQWSAPTLCTDWTVRRLVDHLIGMNRVFAALLADQPPPRRAADHIEADPVGAYRDSAAGLQAAFEQPGVLERVFRGPLGAASGAERLQIRLYDLLAHGWDLARATGQLRAVAAGRQRAARSIRPGSAGRCRGARHRAIGRLSRTPGHRVATITFTADHVTADHSIAGVTRGHRPSHPLDVGWK